MQVKDARSISPEAQEALRKRAVQAILIGMKQRTAARTFGVARGTVARWMGQYRQGGETALGQRPQGRPPAPKLTGGQEAAVVALIEAHSPDQLGLPTSLWTRETVGILIKKRFGLALWVWRVGRSLRRWGLTPQKPARRAYEQDPAAVQRWLERNIRTSENRPKRKGRRFTGVMRWEYAGTIRRGAPRAERERHRWSGVLVSASGATSSPP